MRRAADALKRVSGAALDLIYPRGVACCLCGCDLDGRGEVLCASCKQKMPPVTGACPGCGRSTGAEGLCRTCRTYGLPADGGFAAHDYEGAARSLMLAFKFEDRTSCRDLFAHGMVRALREGGADSLVDCVVPVPMHWLRKFNRGYNQSALLASRIAEELGKPVVNGVLARPVYTRAAARMQGGPAERMENAQRSYRPGKGSLEGRTALLVDDILTSGATVRACAAILRRMGAAKVFSIVAAAVPERDPERKGT